MCACAALVLGVGVAPASPPRIDGGFGVIARSSGPDGELSSGQAKKALTELPYDYRFRRVPLPKGASAAFAGTVTGADKTHFQFGVALGTSADPVALPRSGTGHATFMPSAGFTYTTDVIIETRPNEYHYAPNLRTMKQLNLAVRMEANMQRALCLAATGKQCGI